MVAMNPQTWDADVAEIEAGGYLFYDNSKPLPKSKFRDDIHVHRRAADRDLQRDLQRSAPAPAVQEHHVCRRASGAARHRRAGDRDADRRAVQGQGKAARRRTSRRCTWAATGCARTCRIRSACACARADAVGDRIFVDGNAAAALGCVYGGATVCAWYPITPSSSLAEAFQKYCQKYRVDAGDQAEPLRDHPGRGRDRLDRHGGRRRLERRARLHHHLGPGHLADERVHRPGLFRRDPGHDHRRAARRAVDRHADAHAAGATSSPAPTPRTATPSTCCCSRRIRTSASSSRPRRSTSPTACRRRCSCMTDLDIGMNQRLCAPFAWDDARAYDRGKVMTAEELEAGREFGRYKDVDGDGIPYRTYPGTHPDKGALLHPRHLAQRRRRSYSERGPDYIYNMQRLLQKFDSAQVAGAAAGASATAAHAGAQFGAIYFGSTSPAMDEAIERAAGRGHRARHAARCARSRSRTRVREFIDCARIGVRGRAEPRRAAALAAGQRVRHRSGAAGRGAALRRHADHRALHRRCDRQRAPRAAASNEVACAMTYLAKPKLHHPSLALQRGRLHPPRLRRQDLARCAPAAATTRSPPRSSRPAGNSTSSRTASPSCPASAAARRRRTISSASRTASTPCTGACRRC